MTKVMQVMDDPQAGVLDACYKFLIPIARMLLVNGISYKEFDEVCRRAFVNTASDEFGLRGRTTNIARVATMTGITRKEVKKLRVEAHNDGSDSRSILSPLADLLFVWATSNDYTSETGDPLELAVETNERNSFNDLVRLCMGDVTPGAVKKELIRLGVVRALPNGRLRLERRALIPKEIHKRLESAIIYSLRGLAETIAHNNDPRMESEPRRFERFVESRPMSNREIDEARKYFAERMTEITEEFDSLLNAGHSPSPASSGRRIGIGLYFSE